MIIKLKDGSTARWEMMGDISPRLGIVFYDMCRKAKDWGVKEIVITSIIRHKESDSGVHELGRAIDIRTSNMANEMVSALVDFINKRYTYDMLRPEIKTAISHCSTNYGDPGNHIHLQVPV
jgi:hypothetical protein